MGGMPRPGGGIPGGGIRGGIMPGIIPGGGSRGGGMPGTNGPGGGIPGLLEKGTVNSESCLDIKGTTKSTGNNNYS